MLKQVQRPALLLLLNVVGLKEAGSLWEKLLQSLLPVLLLVVTMLYPQLVQQLKLLGFQELTAPQLELLLSSYGPLKVFKVLFPLHWET